MNQSHVIQLNISKKLNTALHSAQQTNKCKMRPHCAPVVNPKQKQQQIQKQQQQQQQQQLQLQLPPTEPPESTVHCTHIDNDKYMGIIKSWNLFLCAYNGGQSTHNPPHNTNTRPIVLAAPRRRISSDNTANFMCQKKEGETEYRAQNLQCLYNTSTNNNNNCYKLK